MQDKRVVTFETFLILFDIYLSPLIKAAKYKMIALILKKKDFHLYQK